MKFGAAAANSGWLLASLPEWSRFRRATADVEAVQRRLLARYLRRNASTEFGREHGFSGIRGWEEYRERVPVRTYDDFRPWIERIADGESGVLTSEVVDLLEPSSGSSGPEKWIPYTRTLQVEYRRGVAAWMAQNFIEQPRLVTGRGYWSLTPQPARRERPGTRVPVGFDEDSAYLGGVAQRLVDLTLVTRPELRKIADMQEFWHTTLLLLLKARDLRLLSVWHPSYLLLMLRELRSNWSRLLADLGNGFTLAEPAITIAADAPRARELASIGSDDPTAIWPQLCLVSCWGDANATGGIDEVRRSFPGVTVQPKGLVATEAFVTLPFRDSRPLSVRSHFFEFLDEAGNPHPAWSLQKGRRYSIVVTTGGGLYRYRLQDLVEVTGFCNATPSLRFAGKEDSVSDHFGEKLQEAFVSDCLQAVFDALELSPSFAMLAMDLEREPAGYTLYLECPGADIVRLATELERQLGRNPHYELCVRLGQLDQVSIVEIPERAYEMYTRRLSERGLRLGDIKPTPLSRFCDWSRTFA